jgi:DNA polymerase III delta prime subunit
MQFQAAESFPGYLAHLRGRLGCQRAKGWEWFNAIGANGIGPAQNGIELAGFSGDRGDDRTVDPRVIHRFQQTAHRPIEHGHDLVGLRLQLGHGTRGEMIRKGVRMNIDDHAGEDRLPGGGMGILIHRQVCLWAGLVIDALHTMCRSTKFSWFLVRLIPMLLFVAGLGPMLAAEEDPVETRLLELQNEEGDLIERGQAIDQLRELGRQAIEAADGLLAFITDPDAPLELQHRAVLALRDIGLPDAERAGVLYAVLTDPQSDLDLRRTILLAHGDRHEYAAVLIPALLQVLEDPAQGLMVRRQVLFNLNAHLGAEGVVEQLARVVGDVNETVELRTVALDQLRASPALRPETIKLLRTLALDPNESPGLRLAALDALGRFGVTDADAAKLVEILFQPVTPAEVQRAVANLLTFRDRPVPAERGLWKSLLDSSGHTVEARRLAARSLAPSNHLDPDSLELCLRLLVDETEDLSVRRIAAEQLLAHGSTAEPVLEMVEQLLRDQRQPVELRELAGGLWVQTARGWLGAPADSTWESINARLLAIDRATALLEPVAATSVRARQSLVELHQIRSVLAAQQEGRWRDRTRDWMHRHPWISWTSISLATVALLALALTIFWRVLTRVAPMRVWEWDRQLTRWDWRLPSWLGDSAMGLRHVMLLTQHANSPRVLEAWLRAARPHLRQHFEQLLGENGASPDSVPLPVRWNGQPYPEPPWDSIRQRLTVSGGGILIVGEPGTGKTSCALECARRLLDSTTTESGKAMPLPVWLGRPQSARDGVIELDLELRSALALLLPGSLLPERNAIRDMLNTGWLLAFVDGVSEWPAEFIPSIQLALEQLHRHHGGFVVTTCVPDVLAAQAVTRLELSPLDGAAAVGFLQTYLTRRYPEQTSEGRLVVICQHWAALTEGQRMPVQVIRIFADVAVRRPAAQPQNLIAVARDYVHQLHQDAGPGSFEESQVIRVACRLAWAEIDGPETGGGLTVTERHAALVGVEHSAETVDYLERRLGLLERWQPGDRIRFKQRPLASFLAAQHLILEYQDDDEGWQRFLQHSTPPPGSALAMVLHALVDACLFPADPSAAPSIPEWAGDELARRLGLNAARLEARRDTLRARELVRQIVMPENPERSNALELLAAMGPGAVSTLPMLESVIRDSNQDLDVRFGALTALGLLGTVALPARGTLEAAVRDRREQLFIRLKALEFLAAMGREQSATVAILVDRLGDPTEAELLRLRAGNILGALQCDREMIRSSLAPLNASGFTPAVRELVRILVRPPATSPSRLARIFRRPAHPMALPGGAPDISHGPLSGTGLANDQGIDEGCDEGPATASPNSRPGTWRPRLLARRPSRTLLARKSCRNRQFHSE